jgi:D-cysteine desulfhydrase family pyridoxal phosphate-dependent enzyme
MLCSCSNELRLKRMSGEHFENIWARLDALPRKCLAEFPTPLMPLRSLSRSLGGPDILMKRDDLISFGLGGNKVRGLELLIADALKQNADTIVTGAGPQSNHVRATAAAAVCSGLRCIAVLWGSASAITDGNLRVARMLGAEVEFTEVADRGSVDTGILAVAERLRKQSRHPYPIPRGGACALGALGHMLAARELYRQCRERNSVPDAVIFATGSGGTHAGWLLGTRALGDPWRVESFTVSREAGAVRAEIARLAGEAAALLNCDCQFDADGVAVHDGFIGAGYGIPSREAADAIRQIGRSEGILLDPTYTGKAMAGLIHYVKAGLADYRSIVFLHTGGEPAFYAGDGDWLEQSAAPFVNRQFCAWRQAHALGHHRWRRGWH